MLRVFLPVIACSIAFTLLYSFINLLFFANRITYIQEGLVNYLIPSTLSLIISWLLYKPVIKLIQFPPRRPEEKKMPFFLIVVLSIAIPAMIAQYYVVRKAAEVTHLTRPEEYQHSPANRYYTFEQHYVDTNKKAVYAGSYKEPRGPFHLEAFTVIPLYNNQTDTVPGKYAYWLGVYNSETLRVPEDSASVHRLTQAFSQLHLQQPVPENVISFQYLKRETDPSRISGFHKAIEHKMLPYSTNSIIFIPQDKPAGKRTHDSLPLLLLAWGFIMVIVWLQLLMANDIPTGKKRRRK